MKQKDISLIVVVVFISAVISLFLSRYLFASSGGRQQQVDVVQTISPTFPSPDSTYFNSTALDPTQFIQVGNAKNSNPFNGSSSP
ncbi:MAG TPA: hypothetical protein VGS08_00935 [Candidatus Saccharimonadales bacterium]|nr:hypothetical protein [Candidatus Saccharimonadales bacterium]